jgi:hypothetical protein
LLPKLEKGMGGVVGSRNAGLLAGYAYTRLLVVFIPKRRFGQSRPMSSCFPDPRTSTVANRPYRSLSRDAPAQTSTSDKAICPTTKEHIAGTRGSLARLPAAKAFRYRPLDLVDGSVEKPSTATSIAHRRDTLITTKFDKLAESPKIDWVPGIALMRNRDVERIYV